MSPKVRTFRAGEDKQFTPGQLLTLSSSTYVSAKDSSGARFIPQDTICTLLEYSDPPRTSHGGSVYAVKVLLPDGSTGWIWSDRLRPA